MHIFKSIFSFPDYTCTFEEGPCAAFDETCNIYGWKQLKAGRLFEVKKDHTMKTNHGQFLQVFVV